MKKALFALTLILTLLVMSSAAFAKLYSPVYRLYNYQSGEHLYTTSEDEVRDLCENQGWSNENVAFISENRSESPSPDFINEIYRVYNPRSGEHLYTIFPSEVATLTNHGWKVDFNGEACFYSSTNHEEDGEGWNEYLIPVYRMFDPQSGQHVLTADQNEIASLQGIGWTIDGEDRYFWTRRTEMTDMTK